MHLRTSATPNAGTSLLFALISSIRPSLLGSSTEELSGRSGSPLNNEPGDFAVGSPAPSQTPTLNICGALDRCTPAEEALQFHRALLDNGVKSVLVTYPEEGHGVRTWPAAIDYTARIVAWFQEHMPAQVLN